MKGLVRKFTLNAVSLLLIAAMPQAAKAAEPTPVQNDSFSLTLPAGFTPFTEHAQSANSPGGTIMTTNWISKAPTGDAIVVTVSKMPKKIQSPDKLFGGTRDSLLKSLKATLDSEEKVAAAIPTTALMFHSEQAYLRARLAVSSDHFYQVLYVGRSAEQRSLPFVEQLFDSFHINAAAPVVASAAIVK
jgi:hypothetical protein